MSAVERINPDEPEYLQGSYRRYFFERYISCLDHAIDKIVLDVPCGCGWGTSLIAPFAKRVYGVDISAEAISYAVQHYPSCIFKKGDMRKIPFNDKCFDTVICLEGFEHIREDVGVEFLAEASRVCKNVFIMTCPLLDNTLIKTNPYHLREYSENELTELISSRFSILSLIKFNVENRVMLRIVSKVK